jgi:hypothetical protein
VVIRCSFGIGAELSDTPAALLSQQSPIGTLPDEVLLEIFKDYEDTSVYYRWYSWPTLAQVCQRWRHVVAASPRYLGLQIFSLTGRSASGMMSGWPALPIIISHIGGSPGTEGVDHVTAALEHNNRVIRIWLDNVPSWQLEIFVPAMQKPFPELTSLHIAAQYHFRSLTPLPVFPDSFLGGSAPSLRSLHLDGIPFPGLLNLLSSSHHFVDIGLLDIPSSVHIPPEELATCLSPMKHLKSLKIRFNPIDSPSLAAEQDPPSLTRIVLPALTLLDVHCTSQFLEGFVSRLEAPSLENMEIMFPRSDEPVSNISELPQFVSRIESFETFDKADIVHDRDFGGFKFIFSKQASSVVGAGLTLTFRPSERPHLIEDLTPVVHSFLPPLLSRFKSLTIGKHRHSDLFSSGYMNINIGDTSMEQILYSSAAVTNIFISGSMATTVSCSMKGLSEERATVMLPALRNIFVAELQRQGKRTLGAIQQFIAVKGLVGCPVTLHCWEPEVDN